MFGRGTEKLKSVMGTESEFKGEFTAKGILRIDGTVTGTVRADEVILSETASIKGDIIAKRIIVGGMVEGTLRAPNLVEILPKGNVKGPVITNKLLVMEGGVINGKIDMNANEPGVLDFESKNKEISVKR
jgi:cytoskeletal protein CcmA (bactofilin family)